MKAAHSDDMFELFELMSQGVWQIDSEGRTTYVSARIVEMLGFSREELRAVPAFSFVGEEDRARMKARIGTRPKGVSDDYECQLTHKNGSLVSVSVNSIPLYRDGKSLWRQGQDGAGEIDVAVIELERAALPAHVVYCAFGPAHLHTPHDQVEVGASVLVVGFPLGFHDTLHHLPVVRQAGIASSFGLRFQGEGYFLTDARTHRGGSGAPIVMRDAYPRAAHGELPWTLLGVHSARLDMETRDLKLDEALGLNCAWYADILLTLTAD